MAWTTISNATGWEALIAGVRWYRDAAESGYTYSYLIEDRNALPAVEGLDEAEGDIYPAEHWRAVQFQAIWSEDLAAGPEDGSANSEDGSVGSQDRSVGSQDRSIGSQDGGAGQAQSDARDESLAEALDEAQTTPRAPVTATRLADPVVTSSGPAQYTGRGAFVWVARFSVAQGQQVKSWIIQKLTVNANGQTGTFFEAFPVEPGKTDSTDKDTYQSSSQTNSGKFVVTGVARHYVFTDGADPPGFTYGAGMADDEQLASADTPSWWEGNDGSAHNLDFKWGAFSCTLTTVPESGDAERKNGLSDLRPG